jgi:hypothetical protein
MTTHILPDRERQHLLQFYVAPRLAYQTRLALAGSLIACGLAVQLLWPSPTLLPLLAVSLPLLLAGNLFLLVRGYDLKPRGSLFAGEWEKTTRDRFRQACQLEAQVRRWDETFADLTCTTGAVTLAVLGGAAAWIWYQLMSHARTTFWAPVFLADAAVLLLPHWITGTRRGWRPTRLIQQVQSLETALQVIEGYEEPPCQIQPMFELSGDKESQTRIPVAARVFVRFPDGPEDLLGLQFQVSLNNVQGTNYPYLYAVIVARKSLKLVKKHLRSVARSAPSLTVEPSREDDVEVIVIRQPTTKTSGYHTKASAVRKIAEAAWQGVTQIVSQEERAAPAR